MFYNRVLIPETREDKRFFYCSNVYNSMELGFLRKGTWKRILRKLGYAMKHKHKNLFAYFPYVCIVQCASWRNKNVGFLLISKNNSKIQCKKKFVNPFSKIKHILSMKNRTKMTSFDFGGTIGFLGSKIGAKKFPNSKKKQFIIT